MKRRVSTTATHLALALSGLLTGSSVIAQESTGSISSGEQLQQACHALVSTEDPSQGLLCEGYVQGFLQGNPAVVFSEQLPSEYMQRAVQTRAPDHGSARQAKEAKYCLDGRASVDSLEAEIAKLSAKELDSLNSADAILLALDRGHRCQT